MDNNNPEQVYEISVFISAKNIAKLNNEGKKVILEAVNSVNDGLIKEGKKYLFEKPISMKEIEHIRQIGLSYREGFDWCVTIIVNDKDGNCNWVVQVPFTLNELNKRMLGIVLKVGGLEMLG